MTRSISGFQFGLPLAVQRATAAGLLAAVLAIPALSGLTAAPAMAQETPVKGGVLNSIVQPEPPTLMLGLNQQGPTQTVAGKIYQGLLTYDQKLNPLPSLAKSWTVSPDGLTYTFKLFENVTWHDGKPFTAKDVVFSASKFLMEVHPRARAVFARCESITAPDELTVEFKLKEPFPAFLQSFEVSSAPIVPAHLYEGTDFRANPANATPIGTGPFKLKEWVKGSHIQLVRNEAYYKAGLPYLDGITFRVIPDAASRSLALESGQVQQTQYSDVEPFEVPRLKTLANLELSTKGYEFVAPMSWLEINHRVKPLDDKRFRKAIAYAIDRKFIRDKIWFGLGRVPTGPINSVVKFYDPKVTTYEPNIEKAKALLDEMGLKPDAKGVRATVKIMPMPYGETWTRLGEYLKQALGKAGIAVTLESTDAAGWSQRVANWDYEITTNFLYQYGDPALGVARTYISDNIRKGVLFTNTMGYSNPKVDALFASAAREIDPAKRQADYSEVQQILADELPVVWLLEMEFPTFLDKRVRNANKTAIGVNDTYEDVWLAAK
ncbi:peptide/nickel transport system substrate-binding protein [Azospirillum agricola]|uniref:ABC transporter substrate-binding protein n=1 Tax=Azospirillum agricola TaxID=1720247 RepID=UPI001AE190F2|nr:ABC transporter substrate-binding protein [Azospirillum agricola]MBP2228425.1 peptide/nickel transport system substrate-binding protein [Azospirillum agricola]